MPPTEPAPRRRILILGGDSDGNLGDAAILAAMCHHLARAPGVELAIASDLPGERRFSGVTRIIRRSGWSAQRLWVEAREADLIVIGGGGLFQDDDSRIKMPYWAARLGALGIVNPNIVGHGIGAGPLQHAESRLAARLACSQLLDLSVRDAYARDALASCMTQAPRIVPDPAFALPPASVTSARNLLAGLNLRNSSVIGVAVRRWFHSRGGFIPHRLRVRCGLDRGAGAPRMAQLLDRLARALRILAEQLNASLLFLPTYTVAHENDAAMCNALAARLHGVEHRMALIRDPALYKAIAGQLQLMIGARMHPLILAAGMGVPVLGMGYNGKFNGVFDLLGAPQHLLDLNTVLDCTAANVADRAMQAMQDRQQIAPRAKALGDLAARSTQALLRHTALKEVRA